jgi:DNA-binding NarL/FixJ family response regulator
MRRLRIVIADDHQLMRSALMTLLLADGGFEVVGEAESGADAVDVIARTLPDAALIDVRMPGVDGLTVLDEVHKRYPAVRVIMISAVDQDEVVRAALKRGADAFVLKRVDPRDVCAIVRQVVERTVFQRPPAPETPSGVQRTHLTARQLRVLEGLVRGLGNKELAKELWLSEQTVKFHLSNIYRALGVSSRTEAIRAAFEHELVALPASDGS